jgi:PAS domain S-box-containing protein
LHAEETRRASEDKYRVLVEASPDAVVVCDLEGKITFASRQAVQYHRFADAESMLGLQATDLVIPDDRDSMRANIQRLVQEGHRQDDHYTGLRCDGTTFSAEISASLLRDAQGHPTAMMGVYRDITERKEAQDALRRGQQALYRMLQASDRDRELITYEIHDGVAQRLMGALMQFEAYQNTSKHSSKKAQSIFQAGLAALHAAAAETRSLMNRTRSPVLQNFGVKAAIADFLIQIGERPNSPQFQFQCEANFDRLAPALENSVFRIAQEAITNACRHSQSPTVQVTLTQDSDTVILEVRDQGVGFDVSRDAPGRFGLHGIRERTRLLGKDLHIESKPGQGTLIRAAFPLLLLNEQDGAAS